MVDGGTPGMSESPVSAWMRPWWRHRMHLDGLSYLFTPTTRNR